MKKLVFLPILALALVFTACAPPPYIYTVTVEQPQGGIIYASPGSGEAGTTVTLSNTPAADYVLDHYTVDDDEISGSTFTLSNSATVSGVFTYTGTEITPPETFIVTFDSNGGSAVGDLVLASGSKITPAVSTRDGYTIDGWYKESGFTNKWNFATDTVSANITLYAKWIQNAAGTVTLTFDTKGGSWVSPQNVSQGGSVYQPDPPTRTGYTFANWYIDPECTTSFSFSVPLTASRTVYAKWNPITYTVAYDKNAVEATGTMANSSHTYDTEKTLTANSFSRSGYTFGGWNTQADDTGISYTDSQSVKNLSTMQGATITLYAQWDAISVTGISLNKTSLGLQAGESETLIATVEPGNAANKAVTWESRDTDVATVLDGTVTAVAVGHAVITATTEDGSWTATCNVTVSPITVTSVSLNKTSLELYWNETETLIATVEPGNATNKAVTWESSNTVVAEVADGTVIAKALGSSVITVTTIDGSKTATCTVTVPIDLSYFTFDKTAGAITGYTGPGGAITIPSTIEGESVTHIADDPNGVFSNKQLTSVVIPNSVVTIGNKAFYDNQQMTSVVIPNSVVTIGNEAFYFNRQMTSVSIPDSVTSIGDEAFRSNGLTSVTIGNSVTSIGAGAFRSNQLTSITIPDSVTSIGGWAFHNNPNLTAINVAAGNTLYASQDGVLYNKAMTTLLAWPSGKIPVVIPDSVTTIGNYAFSQNQLTSVTIGNSVTSIGAWAFSQNQLTSVTIPNSVTTIEMNAFFQNQLTSVTIPNSVTTIGGEAFLGNQLTSVTIESTISSDSFLYNAFHGDLKEKYLAGGIGTYTRPNVDSMEWTRQP